MTFLRKESLYHLWATILFVEKMERGVEGKILKFKTIIVMMLLLTMIAATFNTTPIRAAEIVPDEGTVEKFGPRVSDIIFKVYGSLTLEAEALEKGDIDTMDWAAPGTVVSDWLANSEILMGEYSEFGWYELSLNLQMWPLGHGAMRPELGAEGGAHPPPEANWGATGWFPPSWDEGHRYIDYSCQRDVDAREFRRAIAHLVSRDAIRSLFGNIAPMQTFIFPAIADWENPSAPKYPYGLDAARGHFDAGGFMDYDGDGWREYTKHVAEREAWKASGRDPAHPPPDVEEIPELQIWGRIDDPPRAYAARSVNDDLILCNVKTDLYIDSRDNCVQHAWYSYDYSIYTDGWGWGREPDMYSAVWNSSKDTYPAPAGDNTYRYHSHEYDYWATQLMTAPNATVAKTAVDQCQMILHDDVGDIPLYTMSGYIAHRKYYEHHPGEDKYWDRQWVGYANEKGYGFYGPGGSNGAPGFNVLNVHPQGFDKGGVFRQGLLLDVYKFDPLDSEWFDDWLVLSKIYEPAIIYDPYNTTRFLPWLATGYEIGTWQHPTKGTCSKITLNINPNILWHDNVKLTPEDIGFTYWYRKTALSVVGRANVAQFDHYDTKTTNPALNDTTVVLYYDVTSWLVPTWVSSVPIIPKHIWESIEPTVPGSPTGSWPYDPEDHDTVIGTGPFRCFKDGVVGRVDRVLGNYVHLQANPNYFRRYTWSDVCDYRHAIDSGTGKPYFDSWVDLDDFMEVAKPANMFKEEDNNGNWPSPPGSAWGEACDVNKDGRTSVGDLMAIGVHLAEPWPPDWYSPYP